MTTDTMHDAADAADGTEHYQQIGRFIYGTARLEAALASLLQAMGENVADPAALHANVARAQVLFAALPAAEGDRIAFTALMHVLAAFAELRDPMFASIGDMPAAELTARNDSLAAATAELRRLSAIAGAACPAAPAPIKTA